MDFFKIRIFWSIHFYTRIYYNYFKNIFFFLKKIQILPFKKFFSCLEIYPFLFNK
jgi:hypothetical protein